MIGMGTRWRIKNTKLRLQVATRLDGASLSRSLPPLSRATCFATNALMTETEDKEEAEQLAAQRVEVFSRSDDDAEWQNVGQGTVMWMPEGERQRLMVLEEEPNARPLGSVVLPSERPRAARSRALPLVRFRSSPTRFTRRPKRRLQCERRRKPAAVDHRGWRVVRAGLPQPSGLRTGLGRRAGRAGRRRFPRLSDG